MVAPHAAPDQQRSNAGLWPIDFFSKRYRTRQSLGVQSQSENFEGTTEIFPEIADDQIDTLIRELNDAIAKLQKLQQQCRFSVHFFDNGFNRLPRVSDVSMLPPRRKTSASSSRSAEDVLDYWLYKAIDIGAADIHFERYKTYLKVRHRIDRKLQTIRQLRRTVA